jgi:hypothetical protein
MIVERTGKVIRRGRGVQSELGGLTKDEPRFDLDLRAFLGRAYNLEAIADYESGPGSRVPVESARTAIETARRFVESIAGCLLEALGFQNRREILVPRQALALQGSACG